MAFNELSEINFQDFTLETMALVGYIFVLLTIFYAKKKNPIFASKGFSIMVIAIILGAVSASMDVSTEIYYYEVGYDIFKFIMASLQIISLIMFALSLLLVFKFTKFMMGEDSQRSE